MKSVFIIALLALSYQVQAQDSVSVVREYHNNQPRSSLDSLYHSFHNRIFISLGEGFADSMYITVNGTEMINGYVRTDPSTGIAGSFGFSFTDSSDIKILRLTFVRRHFYIEERVNLAYKSLEIRNLGKWHLVYDNRFYWRE